MTTTDNDPFVRFARAHLPTKAERAVYAVIAADAGRDWSAGDVAAAAGVSHHEADQALRRFASAGIVDHAHVTGQGHRYRWHPDMGYLRTASVDDVAVDPVCGMPVAAGTPHVARDGDTEVRFCSLPCLVRWQSSQRRRRLVHDGDARDQVRSSDAIVMEPPTGRIAVRPATST